MQTIDRERRRTPWGLGILWGVASAASLCSGLGALQVGGTAFGQREGLSLWRIESAIQIAQNTNGFVGPLEDLDGLGITLTAADLDGDGRNELIASTPGDDDPGLDRGSFHTLFLNADGTVAAQAKAGQGTGGFVGPLTDFDYFCRGLTAIGDLDDDGVPDLLAGAYRSDEGAIDTGAVYVLFMNADGTVRSERKISPLTGDLTGTIEAGDLFGVRATGLGDLDGDGVEDVAVSASFDDDGGQDRGAVYILFLRTDGSVKAEQKISDTSGGFGGSLDDLEAFGSGIVHAGDVDGDGIPDLVVGARGTSVSGPGRGSVWVLFLNANGTVRDQQRIRDGEGGFSGPLDNFDNFGGGVASLRPGGNGQRAVIAVGAFNDDDGGQDRGAVWLFELESDGTVRGQFKISDTKGGFPGTLHDKDGFGLGLTGLGDLDGDGVEELAVGTWLDDDHGTSSGAVWILRFQVPPAFGHAPDRIGSLAAGESTIGSPASDAEWGAWAADELALGPVALGDELALPEPWRTSMELGAVAASLSTRESAERLPLDPSRALRVPVQRELAGSCWILELCAHAGALRGQRLIVSFGLRDPAHRAAIVEGARATMALERSQQAEAGR